jgi:hypothetical protein
MEPSEFTPTRSRRQCRVTVTPSRVLHVCCWHSAETRARFALRALFKLSDPEISNSRSPDSRFGRELESGIPAGNRVGNPRFPIPSRPKSGSRESPIPDSAKIGKWGFPDSRFGAIRPGPGIGVPMAGRGFPGLLVDATSSSLDDHDASASGRLPLCHTAAVTLAAAAAAACTQ